MLTRYLFTLVALTVLAAAGCTSTPSSGAASAPTNTRDVNRPSDVPTTARNTGATTGQTVNNATNRTN